MARWGNGNVRIANDSANGNWTYGYDHVNRLSTTAMTGQSFTYSYDRYGNMSCAFQGLQPCVALSFDPATNRISDPTPPPPRTHFYDNAGNLTADGIHGYVYDGENRLACVLGLDGTCTSATATNYFYDPQGRRVAKVQGSTREEYVYDPQGHVISARDASGALLRTEFYAGDRHVATWNGNGLFWNHADWLGTERVRTDASRVVREICTDTPFGMNLNCTSTDQSPMHFAGLQYDPETQQTHTLNRQYVMGVGRWLTPDPAGRDAAHLDDPQTWNFYVYVRDNPLTLTDPSGLGWSDWLRKLATGLGLQEFVPKDVSAPLPPPPPWKRGNPVYRTEDQAGKGAVRAARAKTANNPVEYGSVIVKVGKVGWTFGDPVTQGSSTSVNPDASPWTGDEPGTTPTKWNPLPMAPGLTKAGEAHVHVRLPGYDGTRFSYGDVDRALLQGISTYLGPTQGGVLKYDPNTKQQSWAERPDE